MIEAPWTKDQVDALNAFQTNGLMHPFTCPNDHPGVGGTLYATPDGWRCPQCAYRQTWAHAFMAQRHPLTHGEDDDNFEPPTVGNRVI